MKQLKIDLVIRGKTSCSKILKYLITINNVEIDQNLRYSHTNNISFLSDFVYGCT